MNLFSEHIAINVKRVVAIVLALLVMFQQPVFAQVVTCNGVYISAASGTVINIDTIQNDNGSTLAHAGTLNLYSISNAGTLQGNGTYNISRVFTNTGTFTAGTSLINFNGNSNQAVPGLSYHHLSLSGTGSTKASTGNTTVNGTLTISSDNTYDLATYSLGGSLSAVTGTGTIKTQNTSVTPVPSGKTWTGSFYYNSSSAQTIVYGNYADLDGAGGNRTIDSLGTIGIAGAFTPGAGTYTVTSSTIDFNGSSTQTIPAFSFHHITLSGASTKNVNGTMNITGALTLGANITLALGSNSIRLKSDSTYTARVATVPSSASITYGSGRFIAERYIKGRRKYRLITSPVTSSPNATLTNGEEGLSIWGNWQNQANNTTPNVGTFITGGSAADGYDQQTTNASMFTYNGTTRLFEGFTTANGKNTKYTPLKAGVPYYLFVYGDRTNSAITSTPNKTTFSTTGKILTGDQTYTTGSAIPLSNTVGRYTLLGNPFASPIDWASVSRTNLSDTYWGWDPNLSSTGGYVTVSTSGTTTLIAPFSGSVGLDQYIQSGQGFFVQTTATSPVLTIHEADKVDNFNGIAFRTGSNNIPLIAINLFYDDVTGSSLTDGALAAFDPSFSNQAGQEDASKIIKTSGEVLALSVQPELLSINARKMPLDNDTLFIHSDRLTKPQYRLQIFAKQLDSSTLEPYLEDTYLNTSRLLSLTDTNSVVFSIQTAVPASSSPNRFRIVFRQAGALSGIITSISAVKENRTIKVNWNASTETGVQRYELQKAGGAGSFARLGEVPAIGTSAGQTYQSIDDQPLVGANHYRVKVFMADGSIFYSRTVTEIMDEQQPAMKIFPNPVRNYEIRMKFTDMDRGKYAARLFDLNGQLVMEQVVEYDGGAAIPVIRIREQLKSGMYFFQLTNHRTKLNQTIFIE
jgi:hypothetical protein